MRSDAGIAARSVSLRSTRVMVLVGLGITAFLADALGKPSLSRAKPLHRALQGPH